MDREENAPTTIRNKSFKVMNGQQSANNSNKKKPVTSPSAYYYVLGTVLSCHKHIFPHRNPGCGAYFYLPSMNKESETERLANLPKNYVDSPYLFYSPYNSELFLIKF